MPVATHELVHKLRWALDAADEDRNLTLGTALHGVHPADIADALQQLSRSEALAVFNWLDDARAAEVLDELEHDLKQYMLRQAPARAAQLLVILPMDDAAQVVSNAPPELAKTLLQDVHGLSPGSAEEIRELLSFGPKSAGRLMTDKFVRVEASMTVRETLRAIRRSDHEVETLTDIYVVASLDQTSPDYHRLVGVFSLRELVRAKFAQTIEQIMAQDVISATVDTDQEEVARIISKYDFLALPILDRQGRLAGIVTVDDIVDVIVAEQTEDVLKLGAVESTDKPYLSMGVIDTVRQRFLWLLLLFVAETATGSVLRHFEDEIGKLVALSFFIPLLIGTGGNAGSQTVTTITRALALGEVHFGDWLRVFWRESRAGVLLGIGLGVIGFGRALLWKTGPGLAGVVGLSMIAIVIWANMVGSVLPIGAKRLGFDPAVMSAPFITTVVDATGLFLYFSIAHVLLHI